MKLTQNLKRRNVAYARYQRALMVLAIFPMSVWHEASAPTRWNAGLVLVTVIACSWSGWMYREAIRWWTEE